MKCLSKIIRVLAISGVNVGSNYGMEYKIFSFHEDKNIEKEIFFNDFFKGDLDVEVIDFSKSRIEDLDIKKVSNIAEKKKELACSVILKESIYSSYSSFKYLKEVLIYFFFINELKNTQPNQEIYKKTFIKIINKNTKLNFINKIQKITKILKEYLTVKNGLNPYGQIPKSFYQIDQKILKEISIGYRNLIRIPFFKHYFAHLISNDFLLKIISDISDDFNKDFLLMENFSMVLQKCIDLEEIKRYLEQKIIYNMIDVLKSIFFPSVPTQENQLFLASFLIYWAHLVLFMKLFKEDLSEQLKMIKPMDNSTNFSTQNNWKDYLTLKIIDSEIIFSHDLLLRLGKENCEKIANHIEEKKKELVIFDVTIDSIFSVVLFKFSKEMNKDQERKKQEEEQKRKKQEEEQKRKKQEEEDQERKKQEEEEQERIERGIKNKKKKEKKKENKKKQKSDKEIMENSWIFQEGLTIVQEEQSYICPDDKFDNVRTSIYNFENEKPFILYDNDTKDFEENTKSNKSIINDINNYEIENEQPFILYDNDKNFEDFEKNIKSNNNKNEESKEPIIMFNKGEKQSSKGAKISSYRGSHHGLENSIGEKFSLAISHGNARSRSKSIKKEMFIKNALGPEGVRVAKIHGQYNQESIIKRLFNGKSEIINQDDIVSKAMQEKYERRRKKSNEFRRAKQKESIMTMGNLRTFHKEDTSVDLKKEKDKTQQKLKAGQKFYEELKKKLEDENQIL